MKTLLLGGARSGKSRLAMRWAAERSSDVACIVTARATDREMEERIEAHRRERPRTWLVREASLELGATLCGLDRPGRVLLVDCLTLWTANCLWPCTGSEATLEPDFGRWDRERDAFLAALPTCVSEVILVTNEVGEGIVPANVAARAFRDAHGALNQAVAAICDAVYLIAAGLPLQLKPAR